MTAVDSGPGRSMMIGMKRFLIVLAVLLVFLAILIGFLPAILSSGPARSAILSRVNRELDGTLSVTSWRLTWTHGLSVADLRFDAPAAGQSIHVPSLTTDAGLLTLIRAPLTFGTLVVDSPVITVTSPPTPSQPGPSAPTSPAPPPVARRPEPRGGDTASPSIPVDLHGTVEVRNGTVTVKSGDLPPLTLFDIESRVAIDSLINPIAFRFSATPPASVPSTVAPRFETEGTLTLPANGVFDPAAVAIDLALSIAELDLALAAGLAKTFGPAPDAAGRLDADLRLRWGNSSTLDVQGTIDVKDLRLAGGPLGEDTPSIPNLNADIAVTASPKELRIQKFQINSPLLTSTGSGTITVSDARVPAGSIAFNATLDLADLTRQFPHALNLRSGLTLDKGSMILGVVLDSADNALTVVASAKTAGLAATLDGRPLALDEPIVASMRGMYRPEGFSIDEARLTSSFATASCRGTPAALDVTVTADLGAALTEARKFTAFDGIEASGAFKATTTISAPWRPGDASPTSLTARGALYITDLRLSLPALGDDHPHIAYLNGTFDASATPSHIHIRRLDVDSSLTTASVSNLLVRAAEDGGMPSLSLTADATLNLAEMAAQFPSTVRLPDGLDLAPIRVTVSGTVNPGPPAADRPSRPTGAQWADILSATDLDGSIAIQRLRLFGLDFHNLDMPLAIHDATARASLVTRVNDGDIRILPLVDAKPAVPLLTLAETGVVVSNVTVTDAMMSDLFGLIHPVLKHCAVASGKTSLRLDAVKVPLDKSALNTAEIRGEFTTRNLVVTPSGLLADILMATKINPGRVQVPDQTIDFVCEDGRVRPSPLEIHSGDYTMTLSGSVGLDGTLDYVADVPATLELVGERAYPYLRDTRLKLRITGTVDKPVVDRSAIEKAVGNLVRDALKNLIREQGGKLLERLQQGK